jgi:hypothetical protein
MAGYWEIWEHQSRNMLAAEATEHEALAVVRDIVSEGSKYSDLSLLFDDPELDVEDLPPPVTGEELARRAEAARSSPVRRTA